MLEMLFSKTGSYEEFFSTLNLRLKIISILIKELIT